MPMDLENVFGMNEGCPEHGAEHMAECTACGGEFCAKCFPRSAVCADCAEGGALDDDTRSGDFEDVDKLGKIIDDDAAASTAAEEAGESP